MPDQQSRRQQTPAERKAQRRKDLWQLDLPLVFAIALCTTLTVVEMRRATEGVWRAWAYTFEWPMIGIICCWIWYRYRKEGSVTKGFSAKWKARIEQYEAEIESLDRKTGEAQPSIPAEDPQLQEWQRYVDDLHRREPPGEPPPDELRN
ncbi:MAG: hypothetical protein WC005_01460 [Candidatus Nanopelagicales bacterium]